ncbi:MAG: UDP-N-acetylmuramoyl-L-alanine--D-glutamate ligase [Alphaproteobacteria bacterium]
MIVPTHMQGRTVAVMGLARSGLAAARALGAAGAAVTTWDDDAGRRTAAVAEGLGVASFDGRDWSATDLLVWSPGVPHLHPRPHPAALAARHAGCPIVCDLELLWQSRPDAGFVGITGTNGKSTTTALIAHLLTACGRRAEAGGNIGRAALSLEPFDADGTYVLEMSSYQLELVPTLRFGVAVLLNVRPHHLDGPGGMHGLVAASPRIFAGQRASDPAIVGADDPYARHLLAALRNGGGGQVVPVSAERPVPGGVWAAGGMLVDDLDGTATTVADLTAIQALPGPHNWQNAAAAYAAARTAGLPAAAIVAALRTYPGLPHRQELAATIGGVRYVNDSKATNAESAARALACYETIYWIAGGLPKEGGIAPLAGFFPRIRHAFLIGRAADAFADTLGRRVPHTLSGDLGTALAAAHAMAQRERVPGAVVLLSPACASFDQWPSFEARGDAFRAAVARLPAGEAA